MDRPDLEQRRAERRARTKRRRRTGILVAVVVVGAGAVAGGVMVAGGGSGDGQPPAATVPAYRQPTTASPAPEPAPVTTEAVVESPQRIRPPVPGPGRVITEGPASAGRKVALTIDDGTCASCVDRILDVVEATGGKVTLGNHTYSHGVSTQIGPTAFAADLERNEDWIPWPPRSRAARATSLTPLTTGRDPGPSS
jgi:hypothetical protein